MNPLEHRQVIVVSNCGISKILQAIVHDGCQDNTIYHIVIHIIIGMFNSNPMIPQYLQLIEYSQRYSQLCLSPLNVYWPAETGTHHVQ